MSTFGNKLMPWQDTTKGYVITITVTILGCIFEEIGWRGYLLFKFNEKYNLFFSSIGAGILWGVWHCKFTYGILGFLLFVILMVLFSIIMSFIYIKTKGNLWYMMLFHFGINIASTSLLQNRESVIFYSITIIVSLLFCITLVFNNKKIFFNKSS